jgi:hypothetical protein
MGQPTVNEVQSLTHLTDYRWLKWLKERRAQLAEDNHQIELARQAELRYHLSHVPPHVQHTDEINIEGL